MRTLIRCLRRFIVEDDAQDMIEYTLLAGLIALVCILGITNFGSSLSSAVGDADTQLRSDGGVP